MDGAGELRPCSYDDDELFSFWRKFRACKHHVPREVLGLLAVVWWDEHRDCQPEGYSGLLLAPTVMLDARRRINAVGANAYARFMGRTSFEFLSENPRLAAVGLPAAMNERDWNATVDTLVPLAPPGPEGEWESMLYSVSLLCWLAPVGQLRFEQELMLFELLGEASNAAACARAWRCDMVVWAARTLLGAARKEWRIAADDLVLNSQKLVPVLSALPHLWDAGLAPEVGAMIRFLGQGDEFPVTCVSLPTFTPKVKKALWKAVEPALDLVATHPDQLLTVSMVHVLQAAAACDLVALKAAAEGYRPLSRVLECSSRVADSAGFAELEMWVTKWGLVRQDECLRPLVTLRGSVSEC